MRLQRGGFAMGLIVGLLVGLAVALGVALYVTKVPVPFVNKVPQRTAEQDAAETERNKNWDPNSPLYGKNPVKPPPVINAASGVVAPAAPAASHEVAVTAEPPAPPAPPAAVVTSTKPGADPFMYFVQAGAYARHEDAEQQRARLAMLGLSAKVTEREQTGRTVYRVRVGPFDKRDEAESTKDKLLSANVESALVRVQR